MTFARDGKNVSKIISKEEAIRIALKLSECADHDTCEQQNCVYFPTKLDVDSLLDYVTETEAVVHCKECKWYSRGENEVDSWAECSLIRGQHSVFDEFFCGQGEEK